MKWCFQTLVVMAFSGHDQDLIGRTQLNMELYPRLIGDVGGTNARFAIETAPGLFVAPAIFANRNFVDFASALRHYLSQETVAAAGSGKLKYAAIAIANPIEGDWIRMTNSDWAFSVEEVKAEFGFDVFLMVNDFTALAMSLPALPKDFTKQCGGSVAKEGRAIGLIGAGTGLGVSGLIPAGNLWVPLEAEGGHVSFSPSNELEIGILTRAKKKYRHVSAERFLSGMGIEFLYELLCGIQEEKTHSLPASEIIRRALEEKDDVCDRTVEVFCNMFGTVAGNLALTLGAKGGIYIGGGIIPRLGERFFMSGFRKRFEDKGRFSGYLSEIPVFVITDTYAAFGGVSLLLDNYLKRHSGL